VPVSVVPSSVMTAFLQRRALVPPDGPLTEAAPTMLCVVLKPIDVIESRVLPWYWRRGFGIQYELPATVRTLQRGGYLTKGRVAV